MQPQRDLRLISKYCVDAKHPRECGQRREGAMPRMRKLCARTGANVAQRPVKLIDGSIGIPADAAKIRLQSASEKQTQPPDFFVPVDEQQIMPRVFDCCRFCGKFES